MASRDRVDVDMFHKSIQYALEKLGKSKSGFERTVVSKFKRKRRVGSGNELVDYSRAPCLGADQKARGLWERDWSTTHDNSCCACASRVKNGNTHRCRYTDVAHCNSYAICKQPVPGLSGSFSLSTCLSCLHAYQFVK